MGYSAAPDAKDDPSLPVGSSFLGGFSTTFRAVVGTGILALPAAVKSVGLIMGGVGTLLLCGASLYTAKLLVACVSAVADRRHPGGPQIEYSDLGRAAFGEVGAGIVLFATIFCQTVKRT